MASLSPLEILLEDYRSTNIGLSVSLLLDGSSSMLPVWELLRLTFREIVDRIATSRSGPTSVSVIQFADTAQTVQEFTSNIQEVRLKVVEMKQLNGNTDTRKGLKRCRHLFKIQNLPYRKLAIVLTDGGSTGKNPSDLAAALKNESVNVICIGIGSQINRTEILNIARDVNHAFFLPSMEDLHKMFVKNVLSAGMPEPSLQQLRVREKKISFLLEFNNAGATSAMLEIHRNGAWTPVVSKNIPTTKDLSVTFECTGLAEDTEYDFQAKVKLESGHELTSNSLRLKTRKLNPMSTLLTDLQRLSTTNDMFKQKITEFSKYFKHKVRVGMVGKVGNGKSAASDTIASVFNGEFEFFNVVGLMGEKSLTPQPSPVDLPGTNIVVLDFFGWDNPDQYESDLKYLIQGLAPDTLTEAQTLSPSFKANTDGQQQRKFYGVFIIVSPAEVAQAQHLAYVQGLYDFINRQGLQPIILLTKCDQIDAELAENPEFIYSSDLVDNYIQQLTTKKFSRGMIFPVISQYEPISGPINPVKEYLFLSALHALLFSSMKSTLTREGIIQKRQDAVVNSPVKLVQQPAAQPPRQEEPNSQAADELAQKLGQQQLASEPVVLTVHVRNQSDDNNAFRTCRLHAKTLTGLQAAIKSKFNISTMGTLYRVLPNGFRSLVDCDDDVQDLPADTTIEFDMQIDGLNVNH